MPRSPMRKQSWQDWPDRLRIRGKWWTVSLVRGLRDQGMAGVTVAPIKKGVRNAIREIAIDAELSPERRVKVFHHEMLHACFPKHVHRTQRGVPGRGGVIRGGVDEEEVVMPLGLAVHDVLSSPDYPRLLAWLRATEVKHRDGWTKGGAA